MTAEPAPQLTAEERVMQTKFGDPDGNCLEACIASITGMDIDEVPHFLGDDWAYQYRKWLFNAGWHWQFFFVGEIPTPIGLVIANGESPRGLGHSVIYDRGKLAHDPHPDGGGILSVDSWIVIDVTEAAIIRDATIDSLRTQLAEAQGALERDKLAAAYVAAETAEMESVHSRTLTSDERDAIWRTRVKAEIAMHTAYTEAARALSGEQETEAGR